MEIEEFIKLCNIGDVTASAVLQNLSDGRYCAKGTSDDLVITKGRRLVPTSDVVGTSYDDLIFYERANSSKTPDDVFDELPAGDLLVNQSKFLTAPLDGGQYGTSEIVSVADMPFSQSRRITVNVVPSSTMGIQFRLTNANSMVSGTDFNIGDNMVIVLYMRTISSEANNPGRIGVVIEDINVATNRPLNEQVSSLVGDGWQKIYLPFKAIAGTFRYCIRLGVGIQTLEIGGVEIINYKQEVSFNSLPTSIYSGREVFNRNETWREDAWNRIEQIRMGNINIIVKDTAGNPVNGAAVDVKMFDHEFEWGTAVEDKIRNTNSEGVKYQIAVSSLFNSAVLENHHKWNRYEQDKLIPRAQVNKLHSLNVKNIRGHTLVWDISFPSGWANGNSVPQDVYNLLMAGNKPALDSRIRNHILEITNEYKGELIDWDVLNEPITNYAIRSTYGDGVVKDWFDWAREGAGADAKLYVNDYGILGLSQNQNKVNDLKSFLDIMVQNNVDFDGIGLQSHFGNTMTHPLNFYNQIMQFVSYGKQLKITEYDLAGVVGGLSDREYEASFLRDVMIMMFSIEPMAGFYIWGFWSGFHHISNGPIFNEDWSLKESGRHFIDLVYNKWWTNESGNTGNDGKYSVRGYYGDYDITVTANGKTKTVAAECYKGKNNTITITLD